MKPLKLKIKPNYLKSVKIQDITPNWKAIANSNILLKVSEAWVINLNKDKRILKKKRSILWKWWNQSKNKNKKIKPKKSLKNCN